MMPLAVAVPEAKVASAIRVSLVALALDTRMVGTVMPTVWLTATCPPPTTELIAAPPM
jgi:hypothetical protein